MPTKVQFVELTVQKKMVPLACGYLQAYAMKDPRIAQSHGFEQLAEPLTSPREEILRRLLASDANLFMFSCYVWNMGVMRYLVEELSRQRPDAQLLLGGPQVIGHGEKYIPPQAENIFIANGEGEPIVLDFLRARQSGQDFREIKGLTFRRKGELITTANPGLIKDVNEIPSPFQAGVFQDKYVMTVFETNRGCPYQCSYCYWGRGDDLSVRKFSTERVMADLEWIARNGIMMLFIGDANWGLLPRDLDFSKHIVELKRKHGAPLIVNYSAAKDRVQRSGQIAELFADAGIISSQAIGIQTTTDDVLRLTRRRNIKMQVLTQVRQELETRGVSTFTELIWPLPGETVASFEQSIQTVFSSGVATIVCYPSLLLHSTPMEKDAEKLGLRTVRTLNPAEELELVIATNEVDEAGYLQGMWTILGLYALYNCRTLRHVVRHLDATGVARASDLFAAFGQHLRVTPSAVGRFWSTMLENHRQSEFGVVGRVVYEILHAERGPFMQLLRAWVTSQPWWSIPEVRVLFELDLLDCPYIYSNTELALKSDAQSTAAHAWQYLRFQQSGPRQLAVDVPPEHAELVGNALFGGKGTTARRYALDHRRKQLPFMKAKTVEENAAYCYGMIQRVASIAASWSIAGQ